MTFEQDMEIGPVGVHDLHQVPTLVVDHDLCAVGGPGDVDDVIERVTKQRQAPSLRCDYVDGSSDRNGDLTFGYDSWGLTTSAATTGTTGVGSTLDPFGRTAPRTVGGATTTYAYAGSGGDLAASTTSGNTRPNSCRMTAPHHVLAASTRLPAVVSTSCSAAFASTTTTVPGSWKHSAAVLYPSSTTPARPKAPDS